jgi:hypothetical protein
MLVVVAHGEAPERLLAALAGTLGTRAMVRAEPMQWGSLLLADAPHARSGQWLVAGRPQRDPWGLPLGDLPLDEAVAEYDRYGAHATDLGSGPFVAVDLATGRLLRAPNGIVPAFEGVGTGGPVLGTSGRALRLLARDLKEIPPGQSGGPSRSDSVAGSPSSEQLRSLRWVWLDEELTARVAQLGPLTPARLPGVPDALAGADRWLSRTAAGDVVFLPPLRRESGRAGELSPTVAARLWSRVRLGRQWLFAPVLERPVRDTIALMAGSGNAT